MPQKSSDKFLIAIVVGVIALVAVAFIVVLRQPEPSYQTEDTPEGVVYNYLLALQQQDFERAYGYLSSQMTGYPATYGDFVTDIREASYNFGDRNRSSDSFHITDIDHAGPQAVVSVEITRYYQNGLFDNGTYVTTTTLSLLKLDASWKITGGSGEYWINCWDDSEYCK